MVETWDMGPIIAHDAGATCHRRAECLDRLPGGMGHATMERMSDLIAPIESSPDARRVRILLYSDDRRARERVRMAVGSTVLAHPIEWIEAATHEAVLRHVDAGRVDLAILDGEAAKSGGLGLARQFKHELYHCPPILVLVGRPHDAWLATWSEADAAVSHPLDPFEVRAAVEQFFVTDSAAHA